MKAISIRSLMAAVIALLVISAPVTASNTDEQIILSTQKSYVFKTYLKDSDIKIQSKDGDVTLTGTVSEEAHKQLAEETAANMPGVKSVNNKLEVKSGVPAVHSDAWVMMKVKTGLLFHRSVSGFATEVDVKEGVVTLRGNASSQAQKDLTTEYAKDVDGVKEVKNEMTVEKATKEPDKKPMGEKIDDASITALVKSTLLYHRSTSALNTKVKTNDGVVTLSGKAKNTAEKELATKLIGDVHGVNRVINNMSIE